MGEETFCSLSMGILEITVNLLLITVFPSRIYYEGQFLSAFTGRLTRKQPGIQFHSIERVMFNKPPIQK